MDEAAIRWENVRFTVPHGFWMTPREILHGLDLTLARGKVMGLVGPNGAGKTTTIKLGAGLLSPADGEVKICGRPTSDPESRKAIGLLTESPYIYAHLRLREWLFMLAGFSGMKGKDRKLRVEEALGLVQLTERAHQMMHTLSKGQLQRAGLAQALVHRPEILLLDEPMSGLDPYWRYQVQQILLDFKSRGGSILFSSHILSDVERLSDEIALLENGSLLWCGRISDMPRKITGYEVICRCDNVSVLNAVAIPKEISLQPDGTWRVLFADEQKETVMALARDTSRGIVIDSFRPVYQEVEEVLFHFTSAASGRERIK